MMDAWKPEVVDRATATAPHQLRSNLGKSVEALPRPRTTKIVRALFQQIGAPHPLNCFRRTATFACALHIHHSSPPWFGGALQSQDRRKKGNHVRSTARTARSTDGILQMIFHSTKRTNVSSRHILHSISFCLPLWVEPLFVLVHASRDEILLDGDRYGIPDDDEDVEEEVFGLKGIPADSDSDDEEDEDAEMDDEEDLDEEELPSTKKSSKSKTTPKSKSQPGFASDEDEEGDEEEEDESWGRSKAAYYSSNAAELDSEDEEAHELEEQEAKRLQAKARESMTDADFGLGDIVEEADTMDEVSG